MPSRSQGGRRDGVRAPRCAVSELLAPRAPRPPWRNRLARPGETAHRPPPGSAGRPPNARRGRRARRRTGGEGAAEQPVRGPRQGGTKKETRNYEIVNHESLERKDGWQNLALSSSKIANPVRIGRAQLVRGGRGWLGWRIMAVGDDAPRASGRRSSLPKGRKIELPGYVPHSINSLSKHPRPPEPTAPSGPSGEERDTSLCNEAARRAARQPPSIPLNPPRLVTAEAEGPAVIARGHRSIYLIYSSTAPLDRVPSRTPGAATRMLAEDAPRR